MGDVVIYKDRKQQIIEEKSSKNRTGRGTIYFEGVGTYVGDIVDGHATGFGKSVFLNGVTFEGNYFENVMQGHGKIIQTFPDLATGGVMTVITEGIFNQSSDGHIDIEGTSKSPYSMFEGTIHDFEYVKGKITYISGITVEGSFSNHGRKVNGTIRTSHYTYVGEAVLVEGKNRIYWDPHGKGTLTCPDGFTYTGGFSNGKYDGMGTLRNSKGYIKATWSEGTLIEVYTNTFSTDESKAKIRPPATQEEKHYWSTAYHDLPGNQGIPSINEQLIRQQYGDGFRADQEIRFVRELLSVNR